MTGHRVLVWGMTGVGAALLAGLFLLYRHPLFEMYLANWMPC